MKNHISLFIFAIALLSGPVSANDLSMTAVKDTLASIPGEHNYIYVRTPLGEDEEKNYDEITFYDGLGRELDFAQSYGADRAGAIMAHHHLIEYDSLGRKEKQWLSTNTSFSYMSPEDLKGGVLWDYHDAGKRSYLQTNYESSPLNRITEQYGVGDAWGDHPARMEYLTNIPADSLRCSFYFIDDNDSLIRRGDYRSGELQVTKATDEDGKPTYTFVDKQGRTLLTRLGRGNQQADTYFVFDRFGRIRYVLPPMINDEISAGNLDLYAYQYLYDSFGRCISKKLPGCAAIRYVYDKADRVILSQNGNQSQKKEWTFTFYDNQGRLALTGLCSFNDPPSLDNSIVRAYRTTSEKDGVLHSGYEVEHFPYTLSSLLQVNYYDDYNFTTDTQLAFGLEKIGKVQYDSLYINHEASLISPQRCLTGTKIKVRVVERYLTSVLYYDYKGRIIQGRSQNHLGGYDTDFYSYTYTGKLFARLHTYQIGNGKRHMEEYTYEYLADGELRDVYHRVDNAYRANHLLYYTYDNSRRVFLKDVGGLGAYTMYTYDVRDQVIKTMCRFFLSEEISYNASPGIPCYNGNISSLAWRSEEDDTDGISKGYRFAYDSMNRMTDACYGEGENLTGNLNCYDEQVTSFDKNGNILGLCRNGAVGPASFGAIDSLNLSYQGNHLLNVTDHAKNNMYGSTTDFKDGIRSSAEYAYDLNGNLIQDLNKGISRIRYNCLNLPSAIEFTDGRTISYLYSADGTKLEVIHAMGDSITTTDYCGKAIYENGKLDKILLDGEGFVSFADDVSYSYHFFLKDYLGNVRVVYNEDREAEEVNHYYPFGGILASSTPSVQPYKYNGKELDRKGGLDWYDYGARMYDPVLGRWHVADPMSEKNYSITPYGYCLNNPVKHIDPDGKQVIPVPSPLPLPFYYPLTNTQSYRLPSDQQIMRHTSGKFAELGQIINHTPKMSYAFGTLLFYQAKNAISPEYEHQRKRDRRNKEGLDRNQANVAESIDTNVSGMMPNGDPAPKRDPKDKKRIIKVGKKVIIGLAIDRTYMELTNPDPTQDAYETHTNQVEGREEYSTDYVGDIYNWIKKLFK